VNVEKHGSVISWFYCCSVQCWKQNSEEHPAQNRS